MEETGEMVVETGDLIPTSSRGELAIITEIIAATIAVTIVVMEIAVVAKDKTLKVMELVFIGGAMLKEPLVVGLEVREIPNTTKCKWMLNRNESMSFRPLW